MWSELYCIFESVAAHGGADEAICDKSYHFKVEAVLWRQVQDRELESKKGHERAVDDEETKVFESLSVPEEHDGGDDAAWDARDLLDEAEDAAVRGARVIWLDNEGKACEEDHTLGAH